jgi:phosphoglucomutase
MSLSPYAGKRAEPWMLTNISRLITSYYSNRPDPSVPEQRVVFGTSGHRGTAFETSFNEWHILAVCQAICDYRSWKGIDGPLFLGIDTHALSEPAFANSLEVLAANGVEVMDRSVLGVKKAQGRPFYGWMGRLGQRTRMASYLRSYPVR